MTHTAILPAEKAGQVQRTVSDFNCTLQGLAVCANMQAKVTVIGEDEDVKALFESIGETIETAEE